MGCWYVKMDTGGWSEMYKNCPGECVPPPDPSGYTTGYMIMTACA